MSFKVFVASLLSLTVGAFHAFGPMDRAGIRQGASYQTRLVTHRLTGQSGIVCRFREQYDQYLSATELQDAMRIFRLFEEDHCYQIRAGASVSVLALDTTLFNTPIVRVYIWWTDLYPTYMPVEEQNKRFLKLTDRVGGRAYEGWIASKMLERV